MYVTSPKPHSVNAALVAPEGRKKRRELCSLTMEEIVCTLHEHIRLTIWQQTTETVSIGGNRLTTLWNHFAIFCCGCCCLFLHIIWYAIKCHLPMRCYELNRANISIILLLKSTLIRIVLHFFKANNYYSCFTHFLGITFSICFFCTLGAEVINFI